MSALALAPAATCTHCVRPIAQRTTRSRGKTLTEWESVSGSTLCLDAPGLAHESAGPS
jgi:hypothetical protein